MGHNPKPKMKMIFVGLAWEWGYNKVDHLKMLWLEPIRIGVFIQ